jgi:hypothetical protein
MPLKEKARRFWSRHRGALSITALCAWALVIIALHRWSEGGPRTLKGAAELLDIGALPVT